MQQAKNRDVGNKKTIRLANQKQIREQYTKQNYHLLTWSDHVYRHFTTVIGKNETQE